MEEQSHATLDQGDLVPESNQPDIWPQVIQDMVDRNVHGAEKYHQPLRPFIDRDFLIDHYQELLDAVVYMKAYLVERATIKLDFVTSFNQTQALSNETSRENGWWDRDEPDDRLIVLMHAELSEAIEALRHGNPPSDHIPEFSGVEEELADVVIRIFDMAGRHQYRVAEAIVAKMAFNQTRGYKHGGKKF